MIEFLTTFILLLVAVYLVLIIGSYVIGFLLMKNLFKNRKDE